MNALRSLVIVLALAPATLAADWPQFFGPNRDGHSSEKGLLKTWPKGGPKLEWTVDNLGIGFSTPCVVGDRIYICGTRDKKEVLIALTSKGKEEWKTEIGPLFDLGKGANPFGQGPRATPSVADGKVYVMSSGGEFLCADAKSGEVKWRKSMPKDLKGEVNPIQYDPKSKFAWGYSWSPLVDGDKVIVYPGGPQGAVAALNCSDGKVAWRSDKLKVQASYASPITATIGGVKQYIVISNEGLHGVGTMGEHLWTYKRSRPYSDVVITTPIYHDGHVYCTVGMGSEGCDLVKIKKDNDRFTATKAYASKTMKNNQGGVVLVNGHIYGTSDKRGWICQPFLDKDSVWEERDALGDGSVIYADGNLYCYTEGEGIVALVEASKEKYIEKGRFTIPKFSKEKAPNSRNWTPPVIANGCLYIRDQEYLFCYKIK